MSLDDYTDSGLGSSISDADGYGSRLRDSDLLDGGYNGLSNNLDYGTGGLDTYDSGGFGSSLDNPVGSHLDDPLGGNFNNLSLSGNNYLAGDALGDSGTYDQGLDNFQEGLGSSLDDGLHQGRQYNNDLATGGLHDTVGGGLYDSDLTAGGLQDSYLNSAGLQDNDYNAGGLYDDGLGSGGLYDHSNNGDGLGSRGLLDQQTGSGGLSDTGVNNYSNIGHSNLGLDTNFNTFGSGNNLSNSILDDGFVGSPVSHSSSLGYRGLDHDGLGLSDSLNAGYSSLNSGLPLNTSSGLDYGNYGGARADSGLGSHGLLDSGLGKSNLLDSGYNTSGILGSSFDTGLDSALGGSNRYGDGLGSGELLGGDTLGGGLGSSRSLNSPNYGTALGSTYNSGLGSSYLGNASAIGNNRLGGYNSGIGFEQSPLSSIGDVGYNHRGLDYDSGLLGSDYNLGLGGTGLGSTSLGLGLGGTGGGLASSYYDSPLGGYGSNYGLLGSSYSSFGQNAYYDPYSQYNDLANWSSSLASGTYADTERQRLWNERMAFEALDDQARMSRYQGMDTGLRTQLGLNSGYWGTRLGGHSGYGRYGLDTDFSMPFSSLSSSLRTRYSPYLGRSSSILSDYDLLDSDLQAHQYADLSSYNQYLARDTSLAENERLERWRLRQEFEALDDERRALHWQRMSELERERLGIGLNNSYWGSRMLDSISPSSFAYPISSTLRSTFEPYMRGSYSANSYIDPQYARYQDMRTYGNLLRCNDQLQESERLRLWQERLRWEEMDGRQRQMRWGQLQPDERISLGLAGGYHDALYGWPSSIDTRQLRPMRYALPASLTRAFRPYMSRSALNRALGSADEAAIAFADIAMFENRVREDRLLSEEQKRRRWAARLRFQALNEQERRLQYLRMREAERQILGLGAGSYFGRRYGGGLLQSFIPGQRLRAMPALPAQQMYRPLPPVLQQRFAPLLSQSSLARSHSNTIDRAEDLKNRIQLSLAEQRESMPISSAARQLATADKRNILARMDADRQRAQRGAQADELRFLNARSY